MSINWFVTLALSIPLAIFANLLTPIIQKWLEENNKKRALKNNRNISEEYIAIKNFKENPNDYKEYLFWVVIRTTFIGSLIGVFTGFIYLFADILYTQVLSIFAGALSIFCSLLIVNICNKALKTIAKVKDFDEYEKKVNEYLKK